MIDYRETAIRLLTEHNVRPSLQRIAVYEYLLRNRTHPTADEIYLALYQEIPTLSKTTVYNVLRSLAENNAVLALTIDDKNVRYDADISEHSHLKCEVCNRLFDIPQPQIERNQTAEYQINKLHVYCWGVCSECNMPKKK